MLGGDVGHRPVRPGDRCSELGAQPGAEPGSGRDLGGLLGERRPLAPSLLTDQAPLAPPQIQDLTADLQVLHRHDQTVLDPAGQDPAPRAGTLARPDLDERLDPPRVDPLDQQDGELVLQTQKYCRTVVHARGLVAVGGERPTACRGHEPDHLPGAPLNYEEPLMPPCSRELIWMVSRRIGRAKRKAEVVRRTCSVRSAVRNVSLAAQYSALGLSDVTHRDANRPAFSQSSTSAHRSGFSARESASVRHEMMAGFSSGQVSGSSDASAVSGRLRTCQSSHPPPGSLRSSATTLVLARLESRV